MKAPTSHDPIGTLATTPLHSGTPIPLPLRPCCHLYSYEAVKALGFGVSRSHKREERAAPKRRLPTLHSKQPQSRASTRGKGEGPEKGKGATSPSTNANGFLVLHRRPLLLALHSARRAPRCFRHILVRRRAVGGGGEGQGRGRHGVAAGHRDVVRRRRRRRQHRGRVRVRVAGGRGADEGARGVGEPAAVQGRRGLRRLLQGEVPRPRHLLAPRRHRHRHRRVPRRRPLRRRQHALRPQRGRLQQDGHRRRRRAPARPRAAQGGVQEDCVQVRREEHCLPCERGVDQLLALVAHRVRGRRGRHRIHAAKAGELGAVAGHEARVGRHVVPLRRPHGGALLREAHDAVRAQDAHGPGRHPQELGAQGHLHLPPQLRGGSLIRRCRQGPGHVLTARDGAAKWGRKGRLTWQLSQAFCWNRMDGVDCFAACCKLL